ncbi:MAG: hypothetical protein GY759_07420 [Chloroflexi bacterium]|nr:hypothetical protein [Chloroflexota bacterium]
MTTLIASIPCLSPPAWAVWERKLIELMDQSVYPFLQKYTREDGSLIWRDSYEPGVRDGADDFYEAFFNWPLFYLLGGGDHMLDLAQRQWEAITRQLTRLGLLHNEYERGYDQFHQSESYIYFYFLCLADPTHRKNIERACRFAGLYLNEDADALNYDPDHHIIRAPHNGSAGPRWGWADGEPTYSWAEGMRIYGLPYEDVPGIGHYDDLKDPAMARRMGQVMDERMGSGDVATNLMVTSLITNAYLLTGHLKYRRWIEDYVAAWQGRARDNGGLLPDNVGLNGRVGEKLGGKWYGGLYGWTWPHGFYNIGMAATVAGINAFLVSQDPGYLQLPRSQIDILFELGSQRPVNSAEMTLAHHWIGQLSGQPEPRQIYAVPYRYGDSGWFDYQPLSPITLTAIWNISMDTADWERIERLRHVENYDWRTVVPFRSKEESGHEQPWLRFLHGDNPNYPEEILKASYGLVCRRLALIAQDQEDLTQVHIHHWQQLNPVSTEALVQLTLGAPQTLYYGGLLMSRLRYYDLTERRPGLPADVAALVEKLEAERTVVSLVNLSPFAARDVLIQAGAYREHHFIAAHYSARTSVYPGDQRAYAAPEQQIESQTTTVDSPYLHVHMPPATEITLALDMKRYAHRPSSDLPPFQAYM